jgi:superkiller protein 3
MSPRTAEQWFREGCKWLELSGSADTLRQVNEELETALEAFTQAVALDPEHADARLNRAYLLARTGRHAEAVDAAIDLAARGLDDAPLHRLVATQLRESGELKGALAAAERALVRGPAELETRVLCAELLAANQRWAEAIDAWWVVIDDRAAEKDPRWIRWCLDRAAAQEQVGSLPARAYERLLEQHGDQLDGFNGRWIERLEKSGVARAAQRAFNARAGNTAASRLRAGNLWLSARQPADALIDFRRALELDPGSVVAWLGVAEAHAASGALDEAISAFERALELDPRHLGARARLEVVRAESKALASPR